MTVTVTVRIDPSEVVGKLVNMRAKIKKVGSRVTGRAAEIVKNRWRSNVRPFSWKEGGSRAEKSIRNTRVGLNKWVISGSFPELGFMEFGFGPKKVNLDSRSERWVLTKLMRKNPRVANSILRRGWMIVGAGHPDSAFIPGGRKLMQRAVTDTFNQRTLAPLVRRALKEIINA